MARKEVRAAPSGNRSDVPRNDRGRLKRLRGGLVRENDGERRRTVAGSVRKGRRELREVVRQTQILLLEREPARGRDVQPKRAVAFVFTDDLIVADEFHAQLIARLHRLRIERNGELRRLPEHFLRNRLRALQLAVQVDVDLRGSRDERRRRREREFERGLGDHFVGAHAEVEVLNGVGAGELHGGGEPSGNQPDQIQGLRDGCRRIGAPHGSGLLSGVRRNRSQGERDRRGRGADGTLEAAGCILGARAQVEDVRHESETDEEAAPRGMRGSSEMRKRISRPARPGRNSTSDL